MQTSNRVDFFANTSLYFGFQSFYDVANSGMRIPVAGRLIAKSRGIPLSKASGLGRRLGETLPWGRLSNYLNPTIESFLRTTSRQEGLRGLARVFRVTGSIAMKKGVASLMAQTVARAGYPIMMASWIVPMVFNATVGAADMLTKLGESGPGLEMGGNFVDSRATYTMRQRAVSAISQSNLSARSSLGDEAFLLHRN